MPTMSSRRETELRQQGAVEAARDSQNSVDAEDAEHKLVQETKKAGLDAYQFDPDASPEAKAAQARSVSDIVWLIQCSAGAISAEIAN